MKTLILDTNILYKYPQSLSLLKNNYKIVVPDKVIDEYTNIINNNENYKSIGNKIKELINKNEISIISSENIFLKQYKKYDIGPYDLQILSVVLDYISKNNHEEVYFVTNDKKFAFECSEHNIKTLSSIDLSLELDKINKNEEYVVLEKYNEKVNHNKILTIVINIIVAVLSSVLASTITYRWETIYPVLNQFIITINIWGTILLIPVIGLLFFWIRSKFRLTYGIIEFIAGFVTVFLVLFPDYDISKITLSKILQMLGGFYILVRSLDNITKGLRKSPFVKFYLFWSKIFPNECKD